MESRCSFYQSIYRPPPEESLFVLTLKWSRGSFCGAWMDEHTVKGSEYLGYIIQLEGRLGHMVYFSPTSLIFFSSLFFQFLLSFLYRPVPNSFISSCCVFLLFPHFPINAILILGFFLSPRINAGKWFSATTAVGHLEVLSCSVRKVLRLRSLL